MSKEEVVAFLNDMIDALTWGRVGLLALFGVFVVALLIIFENRTTIFNRVIDPVPVENMVIPWEMSQKSKQELTELMKLPLVGGVMLTEVDLKKNRRIVKFWDVKDSNYKIEVANIYASLLPQAFFDTDTKNNEQMIAVLNNQFLCSKAEDTVFMRFFANFEKRYPIVCRLAVPPFSGYFAGLVTILLTKQPTQADIDSLKIEVTRVSVEMYLRDIQNKSDRGK